MTPVFLDTVGLLALWDEADQWHADAVAAERKLVAIGPQFFTSTYVLLECGNAAARKPYRDKVDELRHAMEAVGQLIEPTTEDAEAAWKSFRENHYADAGIVDHFLFLPHAPAEYPKAFTNDRHFTAAGFDVLF